MTGTASPSRQGGTGVVLSATPATWPRLLISLAAPLLPPSVGSGVIRPSCQTNGRHIRCVPKKQKSSPLGSGVEVSASPPTAPRSLNGENDPTPRLPVALFGPPSVRRSVMTPFRQRNACTFRPPGSVEKPITELLLLMPHSLAKRPAQRAELGDGVAREFFL